MEFYDGFLTYEEISAMAERAVKVLAPFAKCKWDDGVLHFTSDTISMPIPAVDLRKTLIGIRDEMLDDAEDERDAYSDDIGPARWLEADKKISALAEAWDTVIGEDTKRTFEARNGEKMVAITLHTAGLSVERIKEIWRDCRNYLDFEEAVEWFYGKMQNGYCRPHLIKIDDSLE